MTRVSKNIAEYLDPSFTGRRIEVRWCSQLAPGHDDNGAALEPCDRRGHRRLTLVVALEPVDDRHALLEAWLETPTGVRDVVARQPVASVLSFEDGLLHLDARLGGRRAIALSIAADPAARDATAGRLLYAQSSLLADAGFAPGSCDPPVARLLASEQGAVPA